MRIQTALVAAALLTASASAHALNQSKHYDVTLASCTHAGLPRAFCERVAVEVYNVDANEFNDLSAHSQVPAGSTACDAANDSLWRVFWLGGQVRASVIAVGNDGSRRSADAVAQNLGRALHTLQDDCAHSGMPNPQHAWHSLSDVCRGTTESPDVNPAAFACASNETDAVFSAFIDVLHDGGADFASFGNIETDNDKHWPAYTDVCDFLGSAGDWQGSDGRWDLRVVRPALTDRLVRGMYGADSSQFQFVCTSGSDNVVPQYSYDNRDTSGGAQSCLKIHAFCLGKADGVAADAEAPPYETDATTTADPTPAPTAGVHGGCSMNGDAPASSAAAPLGLLIAAFLLLRRKGAI
jgi:hypothetical protein